MLYFITGNDHKFHEVQLILPEIQQLDIDLPEIQSLDSQEVLREKLQIAHTLHPDKSFIVEDTSLVFDAWNGLPGPLIKWYLQTVGDRGLRKMLADFSDKRARAICTIGYNDGGVMQFFQGETTGLIVEPKKVSPFGRDALFQPDGYDQTFADMSKEEKGTVSHRGKALKKLKEYLSS